MVSYGMITDILNQWANMGVFSYVLPFLLIFAVVFAIMDKTKILGDNKAILAIVAAAIGLLALQFDFVSTFFATIFPRLGVGIAILLSFLILVGLFVVDLEHGSRLAGWLMWVGVAIAIFIIYWSFAGWNFWGDQFGLGFWFQQNLSVIIVVAIIIGAIVAVTRSGGGGGAAAPARAP